MENFDSPGRIAPVAAADQGIVSKKSRTKMVRGKGPRNTPKKKLRRFQSRKKMMKKDKRKIMS